MILQHAPCRAWRTKLAIRMHTGRCTCRIDAEEHMLMIMKRITSFFFLITGAVRMECFSVSQTAFRLNSLSRNPIASKGCNFSSDARNSNDRMQIIMSQFQIIVNANKHLSAMEAMASTAILCLIHKSRSKAKSKLQMTHNKSIDQSLVIH